MTRPRQRTYANAMQALLHLLVTCGLSFPVSAAMNPSSIDDLLRGCPDERFYFMATREMTDPDFFLVVDHLSQSSLITLNHMSNGPQRNRVIRFEMSVARDRAGVRALLTTMLSVPGVIIDCNHASARPADDGSCAKPLTKGE